MIKLDNLFAEPASQCLEHLAGGAMLNFSINDEKVHAMLYLPSGKGPYPIAMLLHGLPGIIRSEDIAQALRRAGMAVLIFSYRGSWGNDGSWSYANAHRDVLAAKEMLFEVAPKYNLDTNKFVTIGHSFGGLMTILLARDSNLRDFIAISPSDASMQWKKAIANKKEHERIKRLDSFSPYLKGTNGEKIWNDVLNDIDSFDAIKAIESFDKNKRFLLIGAEFDNLLGIDEYFNVQLKSLEDRLENVESLILPTGHNYHSQRITLIKSIANWLQKIGY